MEVPVGLLVLHSNGVLRVSVGFPPREERIVQGRYVRINLYAIAIPNLPRCMGYNGTHVTLFVLMCVTSQKCCCGNREQCPHTV